MPTAADTRRVERRLPAAQRKYGMAIAKFKRDSIFTHEQTYFEFKPNKDAVECTTYFRIDGDPKKYRFDYEINLLERLPSVNTIRNLLWWSFVDYRKGLGGALRGATDYVA